MLTKLIRKIYRDQRGITGLETAIILIAFVVVAAVFAYTVLSAGLFSSEKGREAIYAGLETTRSTMELKGSVIALEGDADDEISQLQFMLANALDGEPINFTAPTDTNPLDGIADAGSANVMVISIVNQWERVDDLAWTKTIIGKGDADALLEPGEIFLIQIGGNTDGDGDLEEALTHHNLTVNDTFTVEIKPPSGAVLRFERTLPGAIDTINNLN